MNQDWYTWNMAKDSANMDQLITLLQDFRSEFRGGLQQQNDKFDDLSLKIDKQNESLSNRIDTQVENLSKRMDAQDSKIDKLLDLIYAFKADIEAGVKHQNKHIDSIHVTVDAIYKNLDDSDLEHAALKAQFNRLLSWSRKASRKLEIPLENL